MALSIIVYPGDGVTTQFNIPFALGYINEADVSCRVGDEVDGAGGPVYRDITFLSTEIVEVSGAPAAVGQDVVFRRSINRSELIVDFENGDILNESNLNTAQKQALMLTHEALDGRFSEQLQSDVDMGGNRIINMAAPILPSDAATKGYVDGVIAGTVPDPRIPDYSTQQHLRISTVPAVVNTVRTSGARTPNDGGGAAYVRSNAPVVETPAYIRSGDGAWWFLSEVRTNSIMFGAYADGVNDDAPAINSAIVHSAQYNVPVIEPAVVYSTSAPIVLLDRAVWVGANYLTVIRRLSGAHTMIMSNNFTTLTGTSDAFAAGVPERVCAMYITVDGMYQNTKRTAYLNTSGNGIRIFARKLSLHVRVFNTPGVGVWIECPGGNGPAPTQPGFSREADVSLYVHQTQYEGVIWKGPPDVQLGWVLQADAGSRIVADQLGGKVSSPTYGASNGGQTDGIVFDGAGAEVQMIHSFGNFAGGGLEWRNGGRINADLIIVESCHYGGVRISGAAQGIISKLDIHRTGGFSGDTTADFVYTGVGGNNYGLIISVLSSYRQNAANLGSRNNVEIRGSFLDIGTVKIDNGSTATAGHGVVIDLSSAAWVTIGGGEIARCKGIAPDGLASSGVYRLGAGTGTLVSVKANVRDCDVVFRSSGSPTVETIDLQYYLNTGQVPFIGTVRTHETQEWNIRGRLGSAIKLSRFVGAPTQGTFDPTVTTKQTLTIPHNLIHAPGFGRYHATGILDTPTSMGVGRIGFIQAISADDTNIVVEVQMAVANGANTAPRVTITAEV